MSLEEEIIDWIAERTGHRQTASFLRNASNLDTLIQELKQENIQALWHQLKEEGKSCSLWLPTLSYFLDHSSSIRLSAHQYEVIGERPLARLLKRNEISKELTVWCAGVGSGLEAYGIAMYLISQVEHSERWTFNILGTDLSPDNIEQAASGKIDITSLPEDFPESWQKQFIEESEEGHHLITDILSKCEFKTLNLTDTLSSIPLCDIVLMRNVLPDLQDTTQLHLGTQLLNHLHPDSIVVLEPESQPPGEPDLLKPIKEKVGVFQLNRKILPPEIFNRYDICDEPTDDIEKDFRSGENTQEEENPGYRKLEMAPEDYACLIRYVRCLNLFQDIPETAIGEICKRIELFEFDSGVAMIQAGQPGEAFFIVYKGDVDVWSTTPILRKPTHSATLGPGDVFGEMSIILDMPANATIKGIGITQVFALSRALFEYLLDKNTGFKEHLGSMVVERSLDGEVKRSLKRSGVSLPELNIDFSALRKLFSKPSPDLISETKDDSEPEDEVPLEIDPAVEEATQRDYLELLKLSKELPLFSDAPLQALPPEAGQVLLYEFPTNYKIIKENKNPDALYLISEGRVKVSTGSQFFKKEIGLAILGRGQLIGEMSLLRGGPSIAQVITQGEVRAFRIDRELFKNWCEESEAFRHSVEDVMFEREPPGTD